MRVILLAIPGAALIGTATALTLQHFQKPVPEAFATSGTTLRAN